jgi:hypothetical protein
MRKPAAAFPEPARWPGTIQALSQHAPPNQPAEGSGLLGESQLSGRTECARHALSVLAPSPSPPFPHAIQTSHFSLLTSHLPHRPLSQPAFPRANGATPYQPRASPQATNNINHQALKGRTIPSPIKPAEGLGMRKPAAAFPEPARWPGPIRVSPLRSRPSPNTPSPNKLAEGSGLLGESQLSGRTECARHAPPHTPSPYSPPLPPPHTPFKLLTSHFPPPPKT